MAKKSTLKLLQKNKIFVAILFGVLMLLFIIALRAYSDRGIVVVNNELDTAITAGAISKCTDTQASNSNYINFSATCTSTPPPSENVKMIKAGQDFIYFDSLVSRASYINTLPFDGLAIRMRQDVFTKTPISYSQIFTNMKPYRDSASNMPKITDNFLLVLVNSVGDFSGDQTTLIQNFANAARAAKDSGLKGIFIDPEDYNEGSNVFVNGCGNVTDSQCRRKTEKLGADIMTAMMNVYPEIKVLSYFGPWVSDPQTINEYTPEVKYYDIAWANPATGSLTVGMAGKAAGTKAKVYDGSEVYTYSEKSDFEQVYNWNKFGMAKRLDFVPPPINETYANTINISFGMYDYDYRGEPMNLSLWTNYLKNGLSTSDEYIWIYTERHDWWKDMYQGEKEPVPQTWVDATRAARQ